jgi:branched-subunit amino acid transport protein
MIDNGTLILIAAVSAITYATRYAGLKLGGGDVPDQFRGFLHHVPIAVFAALAIPGIGGLDGELTARLIGAVLSVIAILRWNRLWAALALGMAGFWLARLILAI